MRNKIIILILLFSLNLLSDGFKKRALGVSQIYGCKDNRQELTFISANADINGDGFKDIIALDSDMYCLGCIALYILYGSSSRLPEEFNMCIYEIPVPYTIIYGVYIVAPPVVSYKPSITTGDFNGDGFDDIVIGNTVTDVIPDSLKTFIIYGSPNLPEEIYLVSPPQSLKISIIYTKNLEWQTGLGANLTAADINNDGYDDLITTEAPYEPLGIEEKLYIFYGGPNGFPNIDVSNPPSNTEIIKGAQTDAYITIPWVFDVNNDGLKDLLFIIVWDFDGYNSKNIFIILYNTANGFPESIDPDNPPYNSSLIYAADSWYFNGNQILFEDINSDGFSDLIISSEYSKAPYFERPGVGAIWVLYGSQDSFPKIIDLSNPPQNSAIIYSAEESTSFASYISLGDRNGDGKKDLLVAGNYCECLGKLYLIYGPLDNLPHEVDLASPPEGLNFVVFEPYIENLGDEKYGLNAVLEDIDNDGMDEILFSSRIICEWVTYKDYFCWGEILIFYNIAFHL